MLKKIVVLLTVLLVSQLITAGPKLDRLEENKMKYEIKKIEKRLEKISEGLEAYKAEEKKLDELEQDLFLLNCKLEAEKLGYNTENLCDTDIKISFGLEGEVKALRVEEQLNNMLNRINIYKENIENLKKGGGKS